MNEKKPRVSFSRKNTKGVLEDLHRTLNDKYRGLSELSYQMMEARKAAKRALVRDGDFINPWEAHQFLRYILRALDRAQALSAEWDRILAEKKLAVREALREEELGPEGTKKAPQVWRNIPKD